MPPEDYQKRLEQWEAQQRDLARKKESDDGYRPAAMRVRAPLGCILVVGFLLLGAIYALVASSAWLKRLFF